MTNPDEPGLLGTALQQAAAQRPSTARSTASSNSSRSSSAVAVKMQGCSLEEFKKPLAHLAVLKRTTAFTPLQVQTWHQALAMFDIETINAAVLEMVLTEIRFPEIGDLFQICRRRAIKAGKLDLPYTAAGGSADSKIPTQAELRIVAANLGLKVD